MTNWGWVLFLAAKIFLPHVFLAAMVYRTMKLKTPVLKSSELATVEASTEKLDSALFSCLIFFFFDYRVLREHLITRSHARS